MSSGPTVKKPAPIPYDTPALEIDTYRPFDYERVDMPLYKVAGKPSHI